jgi:predicted DNA-binding protein YlxM (UPF0122 family)
MEKDLTISLFLDFYAAFLTGNQREILDMYYNLDYSLAEIAEAKSISRQGALDAIKRGVTKLKSMEQELKLMKKYLLVSASLKKCRELAQKISEAQPGKLTDGLISEIDTAINVWEDKDGF